MRGVAVVATLLTQGAYMIARALALTSLIYIPAWIFGWLVVTQVYRGVACLLGLTSFGALVTTVAVYRGTRGRAVHWPGIFDLAVGVGILIGTVVYKVGESLVLREPARGWSLFCAFGLFFFSRSLKSALRVMREMEFSAADTGTFLRETFGQK